MFPCLSLCRSSSLKLVKPHEGEDQVTPPTEATAEFLFPSVGWIFLSVFASALCSLSDGLGGSLFVRCVLSASPAPSKRSLKKGGLFVSFLLRAASLDAEQTGTTRRRRRRRQSSRRRGRGAFHRRERDG